MAVCLIAFTYKLNAFVLVCVGWAVRLLLVWTLGRGVTPPPQQGGTSVASDAGNNFPHVKDGLDYVSVLAWSIPMLVVDWHPAAREFQKPAVFVAMVLWSTVELCIAIPTCIVHGLFTFSAKSYLDPNALWIFLGVIVAAKLLLLYPVYRVHVEAWGKESKHGVIVDTNTNRNIELVRTVFISSCRAIIHLSCDFKSRTCIFTRASSYPTFLYPLLEFPSHFHCIHHNYRLIWQELAAIITCKCLLRLLACDAAGGQIAL
jgi:hypothetical protein